MKVCQAMTGSGGWPLNVFLTPDRKPFFAGTYFPKDSRQGMIGFRQLLSAISEKWADNRKELVRSADEIVEALARQGSTGKGPERGTLDKRLLNKAAEQFAATFDRQYGGFGTAPKFPTPHNLLFLLDQYGKTGKDHLLDEP